MLAGFEVVANIALAGLGISFLIFIHELGHYLAARAFGVRVETFSIGFGPRLLGWRRGDTDYRVSIIPLGGYVKMAGEYGDYSDDAVLEDDDLMAKPVWQRFIVFLGGVLMNFAFAFLAFPVAFGAGVPFWAPEVGDVAVGGPAWEAGLRSGDRFLEINGNKVYGFSNIALEIALSDPDDTVALVDRDGEVSEIELQPDAADGGMLSIGIAPPTENLLRVIPGGAAESAGLQDGDVLIAAGPYVVGEMFRGLKLSPQRALEQIASEGEDFDLEVERDGARLTVPLSPEAVEAPPESPRLLGAQPPTTAIAGLRGDFARDPSPLRLDDAILSVDGAAVLTDEEVLAAAQAAREAGRSLEVDVRRDDQRRTLTLDARALSALLDGDVAFSADMASARLRMLPGGALADAGLRDGDELVGLAGASVDSFQDLLETVGEDPHRVDYLVRYRRDGQEQEVSVRARPRQVWDYGLDLERYQIVYDFTLLESLRAGWDECINALRNTGLTLGKLVTGQVGADNLAGPVSISVITYHQASWDFAKLLFFLALLSVNLGFINILPIPVLDGGQILFLLFEKIKGSRLSVKFMQNAQLVGLVAILALLVYVTYNDIARL